VAGWTEDGSALELCRQIRSAPGGAEVILLVVGQGLNEEQTCLVAAHADELLNLDLESLTARIVAAERRFAEMDQRRRANEQLAHQALHDSLTDLPNRALFFDRLAQTMRAAQRQNSGLAMLLIDLDRFKDVNDTYGHQAGDLVLRQVADRLRTALRASDTVARIGGDELAVLLPSVGGVETAISTAQKVREAICRPYPIAGHGVRVGASVGVALYPTHAHGGEALLAAADAAMYRAKRAGGGVALSSGEVTTGKGAEQEQAAPTGEPPPAMPVPSSVALSSSQAELLRTIGQDLDWSGHRANAILREEDGYRVRNTDSEQWFPIANLLRESASRALRRQPH
jgi:diguanylate cyclase (GGDEF)-like protein